MTTKVLLTGQSGSVLGRYNQDGLAPTAYLPFGRATIKPALGHPGFNGQWTEAPDQRYLLGNGYRAYSSSLQRFMQPDRLSPFARGGLNSYSYCGADPINRIDPAGMFFGAIGLAATAAANLVAGMNIMLRTATAVVGDLVAGGMTPGITRLRRFRDVLGLNAQIGNLSARAQQIPTLAGASTPVQYALSAGVTGIVSQTTAALTNSLNAYDSFAALARNVQEHRLPWRKVAIETVAEASGYNLLFSRPRSGKFRPTLHEVPDVVVHESAHRPVSPTDANQFPIAGNSVRRPAFKRRSSY